LDTLAKRRRWSHTWYLPRTTGANHTTHVTSLTVCLHDTGVCSIYLLQSQNEGRLILDHHRSSKRANEQPTLHDPNPPSVTQVLNLTAYTMSNTTSHDDDDILIHCWLHLTCDTCLSSTYPCSWCAVSSTCVPNTLLPEPWAILSPLKSESICPLAWRERWELRGKLFGCRCSTFTVMSVVVAVLGTLVGLGLIWSMVRLIGWTKRQWRKRERGERWRVRLWSRRVVEQRGDEAAGRDSQDGDRGGGETRPLLG
jgi:hypothetical protein